MISKSNNTQVPTAAINILQNTHTTTNMASNGGANNLTNNSKMGSRRIFTPHFKLQVLESYRKDSDCKGNQRATARKYNIHRRQIQKWLQCESNLRSSVASINHSGLKHQFHNVNQQQHQQVPIMIPTNSNSQFGYHHFESKPQQLPLDTARHSVATNSTTVPSIPVVVPSTNASTQGVYAAANLAAVVAAAAAAGAIAIASTSTTNTSSPLCQTVVSGNTAGISSPILHTHHLQPHHHHHHHHYANSEADSVPATGASTPLPGFSNIPHCKIIPVESYKHDYPDYDPDEGDETDDAQQMMLPQRYNPYHMENDTWSSSCDMANDFGGYSTVPQSSAPTATPPSAPASNPLLRRNQYWV
uniref:Brinker DNA-binding domain-containing protein n=1 Tax=Bactrocera dorsalis TaxID=27457 RepID=A0A034VCQ2_BACDO